jgi:two-component system, response regulator PdtaR
MDILIVEDEVLLGLLLAEALAEVGHRVLGVAASRAEAVALVAGKNPDLALVDIELRGGDSGIELARELSPRGVPCVFTTAQPERARLHGDLAFGLVAKPYDPATIFAAVRYFEALQAGQGPARLPRGLELFAPLVVAPPIAAPEAVMAAG